MVKEQKCEIGQNAKMGTLSKPKNVKMGKTQKCEHGQNAKM